MVICTVYGDHGLNVAYNASQGCWHRQFSTTPAKLRKPASSCDICMATTTVLDAYADWNWDDEITKTDFASKPGVAMVLWWLDKNDKAERNVQLHSPEGKISLHLPVFLFPSISYLSQYIRWLSIYFLNHKAWYLRQR